MESQPRTVPGVLDRIAAEFSDHEALVTDDRTLTYAELRAEVDAPRRPWSTST